MQIGRLDGDAAEFFLAHSPHAPLAACVGISDSSGEPVRIAFEESEAAHVMIVGRSRAAALGICTAMLLDLARQIVTTPDRRGMYTTPPFSILDLLGTEESRVFTDAAMSLPLAIKLERATDTAMTAFTDFDYELTRRQGDPDSPRHAKFLFLCGLQAAHGIRSRGLYRSPGVNPQAPKFARLLRRGGAWSLHTIVWCNSFVNLDLTMADGIGAFGHVVILDGAGPVPGRLAFADGLPADRARYVDARRGTAVPIVPFAVPTDAWCEAAIRSFE
ncbi:hypothetical protein [Allonocardiopsis opalescens]|uniref:Uncharacterized protein n=1 Tax=Allonocardiopsis opalescens TaxID=1144618 RepID=A0A2T0Q2I1_9ACTN|nr:hypothetical protein [Allonocardiopsis opalescens]PRX98001.1 hypothetical protein CLV72_105354 [Allonocardiopsis opalescens]